MLGQSLSFENLSYDNIARSINFKLFISAKVYEAIVIKSWYYLETLRTQCNSSLELEFAWRG